MPIATLKPTTNPLPTGDTLKATKAGYKGIIVDNKREPVNALLSYVSGFPWTVNYYSQVQTLHTDIRALDVGQQSVYQQYSLIKGMDLRVTSPIKPSQDSETALLTVTGDAIVYPFLVPNVDDVFIANIGDNLDGLFRITNVTRNSSNLDSVHTIDYELIEHINSLDNQRYRDLEAKVTKVFHFDKNRLMEGLNPNLDTEEYGTVKDLY